MAPVDALTFWTTVSATLFACGFIALFRRQQPLKGPFPPGPKPRPIIGNILDILAPEPWLLYMKWGEEYQNKIISIAVPGKRLVVLNSAEDAVELLERRAGIYSDRARIPLIELSGWTFNTGLMQNNERWRHERRIVQQNFKRESVARFQPIQMTKVHAMLRQLLTDPESFSDHYKTLSAAIILDIMYGYDAEPKNDRIVKVVERAVQQIIENGANPSVAAVNMFPSLRYLPRWFPGTSFHRVIDDCREFTKDMLNVPFEYVRKSMREGSTKTSLVRSLLESNTIGEESVKGIAGTAFSAGMDTVVSVLECWFFGIALHPEKQRKAQAEIDRVVGPDRLPTWSDHDSLPYIEAMVRETLRWLPPFPLTVPHVPEEDDLYKGYFIPKGSIVYPNVWAMTHDKTKFEDPDSFIPERFIDENGKLTEGHRSLAFGFGRRLCPGQYLANNSVWLTVATVLATFHIGLPFDEAGNQLKFSQIYTKADSLHLKPYRCSITPRSTNARKLVEATEYTAGY
ncbi:O-methylsterigmatocystin oxidoreductase [Leucoagaricus sp. SymC.cos]|nr:O-methylsterigmatocystin oxidoreductase [Leucoagaricus sp. SymC.cos]